jgi:hypothetical protein
MFEMGAKLDASDALQAIEATSRNYRTTVRRAVDIGLGPAIRMTRQLVEAEEGGWFERRKAGLIKGYIKIGHRLRYAWRHGDSLQFSKDLKSPMAAAVEFGGQYVQWVEPHERHRTKVFGVESAPFVEQVRGYTRMRHERTGKHYLQRSLDARGEVLAVAVTRALDILFNERRAPTRDEIGAML